MNKEECEVCGKIIEGYSVEHTNYMMAQHKLTHRREKIEKEKQEKKNE